MKNLLKRSMAFMLVACMLLSVVPPAVFAVAYEETSGTYTYDVVIDASQIAGNGYPVSLTDTYGDFSGYARTGSSLYKPYVGADHSFLQVQSGRPAGSWYALKFNVANAGIYDITLSMGKGTGQMLDVHFVPVDALESGNAVADNNTAVEGFENPYRIGDGTAGLTSEAVEDVTFQTAGDYLIVFELVNDAPTQFNFLGFTMTKVGDVTPPAGGGDEEDEEPDTQEVTLPYNFVSGDGNVYNNRADSTSSETDLPMSSGMSFDSGSWSYLAGSCGTGGAMVTTGYIAGNLRSASYYYAVKLYNIPATGGTAELTFTTASGHSAVSDVYILPGDTESIVTGSLEDGDKLGTLPAYTTSATTVLNATIAPEDVIENSVVLVFRGTGTGTNLRCASLQMKVTYSTAPAPGPVLPTGAEYNFSNSGVADQATYPAGSTAPQALVGSNWTIYKSTAYNGYTQASCYQANGFGSTAGHRFVIEIDNAAAGLYSLSFEALGNNSGGAADVYMTTTAPEGGWTNANIRAFDLTTATSLGLLDSHNSSSKVLEIPSITLEAGKVYFVFQGSVSGMNAAAGHFRIASLSTTYVGALPDSYYADAVEALIAAIGEVTLASEDAIVAARTAYDDLTPEQKALVENYETLTVAEAALEDLKSGDPEADQNAANAVIALIDAIGTVNIDSEADITAARNAYDALTDTQEALVTNYQTLLDAEATLAALKQQTAVDEVIAKIDAIGTVTVDSEAAISAARTAYNALNAAQKALVTNYDVLVAAEHELFNLSNPNPDPDTFDGTVYDFYDAVELLGVSKGNHGSATSAAIEEAYAAGTLNFGYYTGSGTAYFNNNRNIKGVGIMLGGYAKDWFAVKIKAPGTGSYKFGFTFPAKYSVNYSTKIDAYMIPMSAIAEALAAAGTDATEASVITALLASGEYAPVASKNVKKTTNSGELDEDDFWGIAELTAGVEYAVIFQAAENKHGGTDPTVTTSNVWIVISGFNLSAPPSATDVAAAQTVMDKINAIGTVTRDSADQIADARAAYEALTAKQKELVENLAVLEKAEARLAELLDPANPIEYIFKNPYPATEKGYPSAIGLLYGDFTDYARSGNIFKPYASYAQPQTSFLKGKWIGMKFTVDKAGDYDVALNMSNSGTDLVTLDVYFVRANELIQGSGNSRNQAFIDGLASNSSYKCYKVDIANAETLSLTGVQLDADEYVIVMINTSGYSVQISETKKEVHDTKCNFRGFAISRTGDYTGPEKVIEQPLPDPNTDKLVYDFYYGGVTNGTSIFDSAIMEVMGKEYALNKQNWIPANHKVNTVISNKYGTTFQSGTDTKRYPWKGIASSTGVGEWMAVQIKAPGTGTYDLTLEHSKNVNGTTGAKVYVIPVSALKDLSVASIDAAIADDTYKLINTVSFRGSNGEFTTEMGQANFEKGKDYILVFYAAVNKHGSTKLYEGENEDQLYEAFILPQKLTATKFVAPDPLNVKDVTYRFHRPDRGESVNVFSDGALGALTNEYIKGVSYWKPYATTVGTVLETFAGKAVYLNGNAKSYKYEAIMVNSLPGEWIGFQIKSPGDGLYTLSLTYGITTNCTTKGEIHIIPLDKLSGDPVEAVEAALKTGEYKLQRDVNFKKGSEKYNSGKYGQFTFEYGEEYVVVFKSAANKHGGEGIIQTNKETGKQNPYQGFMILQEMKLTYATKVETFEEEEELAPDVTGKSDPEAAAAVDALIDAIGTEITLDSSTAIAAARAAYDLLTEPQKKLVTKYQVLLDAEAKLAELVSADDKLKADAVIALIDAIGPVTLESENAIVAARIAYTLLTNEQRALVTNYSVLLAAEAKLAELKGTNTGSALDQASADAVEALIDKIGTVTLKSEGAISAARNAYNALTDTQKLLVENYDVLVKAEKDLAALKAKEQAEKDADDAEERKSQQITIMIIAAIVAAVAAGVVTIFAVPSIRTKVLAIFSKNKKKV